MYLSAQNQLTLLHDLLNDQMIYQTISYHEYQQIKQLVRSIMTNRHIKGELRSVLPEIYYYSIKGENAQSPFHHMLDNQEKIKQWLRAINREKLHISS